MSGQSIRVTSTDPRLTRTFHRLDRAEARARWLRMVNLPAVIDRRTPDGWERLAAQQQGERRGR